MKLEHPRASHRRQPAFADGLPRALWWEADAAALCLLDQTALPARREVLFLTSAEAVTEAIARLRVRGAPAIGVAAAYGLALAARTLLTPSAPLSAEEAMAHLARAAAPLRAARPTAVNLGWALDRLLLTAERELAAGVAPVDLPARLLAEAHAVAREDAAACQAIGEHGAALLNDGDTVLTHCNAGALATSGIGTALAPIYVATRAGKRLHVLVDETRPVLQGARLTAWELHVAGIPLTLITDSMAAVMLATRDVRAVLVGADRIAANGDTANKIGTYGLAVLAAAHGVPFYVLAPRSTLDLTLDDGTRIPIEERAADEVASVAGNRVAPEGVAVANPAFDVTPARYITAIVTEAGIARPPYTESLRALETQSG